jgi:histidinol phosphatase-like PHP family hydrolase
VHRFPGEDDYDFKKASVMSPEDALRIEFQLSMAALDNPEVDILGHPFGMSRNRFHTAPTDEMLFQLIMKATQKGVAIEVNPRYCPDPRHFLSVCQKMGALVSLGSDAHSLEEVGRIVSILRGSS